jgi:hypothetical protein
MLGRPLQDDIVECIELGGCRYCVGPEHARRLMVDANRDKAQCDPREQCCGRRRQERDTLIRWARRGSSSTERRTSTLQRPPSRPLLRPRRARCCLRCDVMLPVRAAWHFQNVDRSVDRQLKRRHQEANIRWRSCRPNERRRGDCRVRRPLLPTPSLPCRCGLRDTSRRDGSRHPQHGLWVLRPARRRPIGEMTRGEIDTHQRNRIWRLTPERAQRPPAEEEWRLARDRSRMRR